MKITAKLHAKFDTVQVSDNFKKREFVVEYSENPMYPQYISFQLTQDKTGLIDQYEPGAMIGVNFNLRGRKWTNQEGKTKYFNTIEAWKVGPAQFEIPQEVPPSGKDDDLPF